MIRRLAFLLLMVAAALGCQLATATATDPDASLAHILRRVTYGPRPGDIERVKAMGLSAWLERQLQPETIDDRAVERGLATLPTLTMSIGELQRAYPRPDADTRQKLARGDMSPREMREQYPMDKRPARIVGELQTARMLRAVTAERQLQEVMVDFWLNHFNVFAGKGELRWYLPDWERTVIRPNALGRFPTLLRASARHPAMLFYLDNWLSTRPDFVRRGGPDQGRRAGLNENYARELMELHTLGVDGGYTQRDVTEVARAFTGWTIDRPRADARFVFRSATHDYGAKVVLGRTIQYGGERDGEAILDMLARHPSTARFLAGKLVRRFVADDPPPALVERVVPALPGHRRRHPRHAARDLHLARVPGPGRRRRQDQEADGVRGQRGARRRRDARCPGRRWRWRARRRRSARASTRRSRPPATPTAPRRGSIPARSWPDELRTGADRGPRVRRARGRGRARPEADRQRPEVVLERLLAALIHGEASAGTRAVLVAQLGTPEITRLSPDDRGPANTDVNKLAALVLGSPEFQRR